MITTKRCMGTTWRRGVGVGGGGFQVHVVDVEVTRVGRRRKFGLVGWGHIGQIVPINPFEEGVVFKIIHPIITKSLIGVTHQSEITPIDLFVSMKIKEDQRIGYRKA